jgi:YVTN family beta-propeller protein
MHGRGAAVAMALLCLAGPGCRFNASPEHPLCLSPTAMVVTKDGKTLFIACATANQVLRFDLGSRKVTSSLTVPASPSGLALSAEDSKLYVTCAAPESQVCIVDLATGAIIGQVKAGHTAMAPVLSPDGKTFLVCNRFNNDVSIIDLQAGKELRRVAVQREPVAAAITHDGKYLLVANLLPNGPANADYVGAAVSVVDVAAGKVVKELRLPNGSGSLNDIRVSPDGKYAVVTHLIANFHLPTTQIERGWMNTNAKTIIDLATLEVLNSVLLDDADDGAANPWGIAWSADGAQVVVAHAGTHEVSVIDFPALLARLARVPRAPEDPKSVEYTSISTRWSDVRHDLGFLAGVRTRIKLPGSDRGPRAVVKVGTVVYTANYFSDTLTAVDLATAYPKIETIPLGPKPEMSAIRKGEAYFHDASICLQGWQSCSSCHPGDGRVDGLNWDLLNDGLANPKNVKSLLLAHKTPPAMSLGVRDTAQVAVRSGIRHSLFTVQPEEVAVAIDEYLKSLKPVPSPSLVQGGFSKAAGRGRLVYNRAGCGACHPPGLFTDLGQYEVGTASGFDKPDDKFDTPALIEAWRTAPYLHDGSAATLREVVTTRNLDNRHGKTSGLTSQEVDDLCTYLLSL